MNPHRPTPGELLESVLLSAGLGWRLIPLHEILPSGACSCGVNCGTSAGKHPRPAKWQEIATSSQATLRDWWRRTPRANIGMRTGEPLVGVDVDPPNGEKTLKALSGDDLPITLEMTTGKGRRLLYEVPETLERAPQTVPLKDDTGETVRLQGATGAQCVLPPSWHPSGKRYEWVKGHGPHDIPAALMPLWMIRLMCPPPEPTWTPEATRPIEAGAPWTEFNARADWMDVLPGAKRCGSRGDVEYVTRPGKSGGVSASIGHYKAKDGSPALHVFSGNWPHLQADRTYDKTGAWCRIAHGGDFGSAARDMIARGFGKSKGGMSLEERVSRLERENWELARVMAQLIRERKGVNHG